jgi:CHASE2 domain-containing sensor protein
MSWKTVLQRLRILPREPREGLLRLMLQNVPTILIISLISLGMDYLGWFKGFETYALDSLLRIKSSQGTSNVVIVTIDDQDYRDLFGGTSPLDPAPLHSLLSAIETGQPRVIGVDIDTSEPRFAADEWPPAVWARDARPVCAESGGAADDDATCDAEEIVRQSACGGKLVETLSEGHGARRIETTPPTGVVVFPQDFDGVVRRYRRQFRSAQAEPPSDLAGEVDTLPWAIVQQYVQAARAGSHEPCAECERIEKLERHGDSHELVLNFAGDRYRFKRMPARLVLEASQKDYWRTNSPLKGTIVLVGGTYRAARDSYVTPVGTRYGVELIAQAIESDLQGGGIREINWIVAMLLEFIAGAILIFLNWRFTGRGSVYVNLVAIVLLSITASFLAFNAVAYWLNFTAVLLGIWIHLLWESSQEKRHLRRELEEYRRRERETKTV